MATREEYIEKLEQQLKEWNSKIDELQEKGNEGSKELKGKVDEHLADLKEKQGELNKKLDKIKDAGSDHFDQLKEDTEVLWGNAKEGFDEVTSILQE